MSEIKYPPNTGIPTTHHTTHEPGGTDEVFGIPAALHAASHISGADQIQLATSLQKGLMSAAYAGKADAQALIDPKVVHVDINRTDVYSQDGSPQFPFKTIQGGVTHAEAVHSPSATNPVLVMVNPGTYDENVVVHMEGVHFKGRGGPYTTTIAPTTGSGLTFTNATALSLTAYDGTGVYSDLVNQGDAGPQTNGVWGITVSGPVGNAFPPVRLLGVKGDASATTTDFALGLYMEHVAIVTANAVAPPIYARNVNTAVFDVGSFVLGNGTTNNATLPSNAILRITGPTNNFTLTGMTGGVDGRSVILWNTTAQNMSINNEAGGSTAANRFTTPTGGTLTTAGQGAFHLFYDGTTSRWIVTAWSA